MGWFFIPKRGGELVLRRYWIEKNSFVDSDNGQSVIISGDSFKHICVVCRQDISDEFEVLCGDNNAYKVKIVSKSKKQAIAAVLSHRQLPALKKPHIELCVSLPKFNKFELILEKSVELSVFKVRPFFSDNSFVRNAGKISGERLKRWNKIILSATQQSGRGQLMTLEPACTLGELLESFNQQDKSLGLFPYEGECLKTVKSVLKSLEPSSINNIWTFVGSEGGFSLKELELFKSKNLEPLTLGEQVLRVETACVSMASIIKYELVD